MAGYFFINDHDVETDLGLTVVPSAMADSGLQLARETVIIPNTLTAFANPDFVAQPRIITLGIQVRPATVAARRAALNTLLDVAPIGLLHELRFGDGPDFVIKGYVRSDGFVNLVPSHPLDFPTGVLTLDFACPDPAWLDRSSRSIAFAATRTDIPGGTLYNDGVVWLMGAATTPVLTLRKNTGDPAGSMTFATVTANVM